MEVIEAIRGGPSSRARMSPTLPKSSYSSSVASAGSAIKHGISSPIASTVSPSGNSLDKASDWLFQKGKLPLPFLYLISKSNYERRSLHRIDLLLGTVIFIHHLSEAWSVCMTKCSPYKYGLKVWTAQITAKDFFSDTEYFPLAAANVIEKNLMCSRCASGCV